MSRLPKTVVVTADGEEHKTFLLPERSADKKFLSIEVYDPYLDREDPKELLDQFRDPDGKVHARSKWFFANGEFELRPCEVVHYDFEIDRFVILWPNGATKNVSRLNLMFKNEDEGTLQRRVAEAARYREDAELIMQYHYLISRVPTEIPDMPDEIKARISFYIHDFSFRFPRFRNPLEFLELPAKERYKIPQSLTLRRPMNFDIRSVHETFRFRGYNFETIRQLLEEVEGEYKNSNKRIEFDAALPYSGEKYDHFKRILDPKMFVPLQDRILEETDSCGVVRIEEVHGVLKKGGTTRRIGRDHFETFGHIGHRAEVRAELDGYRDFYRALQ